MGINATAVDHVVMAVNDLDAAIETYENTFGLKMSERHPNPGGFEAAIFPLGDGFLELVTPSDDNERNPVRLQLEGKGEGPFILSLAVADIDAAVADLRAKDITVTDPPATITRSRSSAPRPPTACACSFIQR